jgi:UDP-N-acetylglucosamine:LPS N-acetylglucosamine transferase
LTPDSLAERVLSLLADAQRCAQLGRALAASMPRDAADRIAALVLGLA